MGINKVIFKLFMININKVLISSFLVLTSCGQGDGLHLNDIDEKGMLRERKNLDTLSTKDFEDTKVDPS